MHSADAPANANTARASLQALAAAALLLPGLAPTAAKADEPASELQLSHYRESRRTLIDLPNSLPPLTVDSLRGSWQAKPLDALQLRFEFAQDSWSGATPITTAPLAAHGNRAIRTGSAGQLITVGASPYLNGPVTLDRQFTPMQADSSGKLVADKRLVHTLSSASPETRREASISGALSEGERSIKLTLGGSDEPDYQSRYASLGTSWDFNQKLSQLSIALRYGQGRIDATLDHDAAPYITKTAFQSQLIQDGSQQRLHGQRNDSGIDLGLSQVIDARSTMQLNLAYSRNSGYLSNPYRAMSVIFVDPRANPANASLLSGDLRALLEQRPGLRRQWSLAANYQRYLPAWDAALALGYRYFHDDWQIRAHTVNAEWRQALGERWTLTPSLRYYRQSAASFYQPYLLSQQAYRQVTIGPDEQVSIREFNPRLLPGQFSSDPRLAAFGAISAGLTLSRQLGRGASLQLGGEYYRHAGALTSGGEASYADYHALNIHAALQIALDEAAPGEAPLPHHAHQHTALPAGLLPGHLLAHGGDWMLGYRYSDSYYRGLQQAGSSTSEAACGNLPCSSMPSAMTMRMYMPHLMWAASDSLTLMLMPQFVDMRMDMRRLAGASSADSHAHRHASSGVGDTELHALFKLGEHDHAPIVDLGISLPTGATDLRQRRSHQRDGELLDYAMQPGSGTVDVKPALSWQGGAGAWSWGSQLGATVRLQSHNRQGYALGNTLEANLWQGVALSERLSLQARASYQQQGALRGSFREAGPISSSAENPANYGGRSAALALGFSVNLPNHQQLAVAWQQPVWQRLNGTQLSAGGSLLAEWRMGL
ncbi:DUF3570 domain-containing protein [Chitinimonas sp.]|uniref:DUF3570 domain-containing protein n=1 Tax=Chitinimonas sp. TaxID=1934313 RepID=UPI0035AF5BD0